MDEGELIELVQCRGDRGSRFLVLIAVGLIVVSGRSGTVPGLLFYIENPGRIYHTSYAELIRLVYY
jgi:hypothetical protein